MDKTVCKLFSFFFFCFLIAKLQVSLLTFHLQSVASSWLNQGKMSITFRR